jgi:hypothetical protein
MDEISDEKIRLLICQVLIRAVRDARAGDELALSWFSTVGMDWIEAIGMGNHPEFIELVKKPLVKIPREYSW